VGYSKVAPSSIAQDLDFPPLKLDLISIFCYFEAGVNLIKQRTEPNICRLKSNHGLHSSTTRCQVHGQEGR
jgi:hypothetical protein